MNQQMNNDPLHDGLRKIGATLPEPSLSQAARDRIEAMADEACAYAYADVPALRRRLWRRTTVLGGAAAALAVVAGIFGFESQRLSRENRQLVALMNGPHPDQPSVVGSRYVAVNLYHPSCPIATRMAPEFERLARLHTDDEVPFITLDVSPDRSKNAAKQAKCLGLGFMFDDPGLLETGRVFLVDRVENRILATERDAAKLDTVESEVVRVAHRRP